MHLELSPLKFRDKQVLRNLMELNMHDQSEFDGYNINEHGLYDYRYIDHYHTDDDRKAYFVRADGRLAGFVLLRCKATHNSLAEFFILRKYRHQGVGRRVAERIFELFPGRWHVSQFSTNLPAQMFWRKMLSESIAGDFLEGNAPDEDFPHFSGPVQKFAVPVTTQIYLVRHAHSAVTADEAGRPLSPKGEQSLVRLNEIMAGEFIDAVYSSPYRRAVQTVEGIAKTYDCKISIIDGFRERQLSVSSIADREAAVQRAWEQVDFTLPGGESNRTAAERGIIALREVLRNEQGKRVAIGVHGTIMTLIMHALDGEYGLEFSRSLSTPDIYRLTFHGDTFVSLIRLWCE